MTSQKRSNCMCFNVYIAFKILFEYYICYVLNIYITTFFCDQVYTWRILGQGLINLIFQSYVNVVDQQCAHDGKDAHSSLEYSMHDHQLLLAQAFSRVKHGGFRATKYANLTPRAADVFTAFKQSRNLKHIKKKRF